MAEQYQQDQYQGSDFQVRLRDIDERNRLIRERVLLLGKNLISSKQETEDELEKLKRENMALRSDLDKIKRATNSLITQFNKFVKREELMLVERMLKDFQPLEFMRRKDVEELIDKKIKSKKQIKTSSSKK
jgi:hypothetical protein